MLPYFGRGKVNIPWIFFRVSLQSIDTQRSWGKLEAQCFHNGLSLFQTSPCISTPKQHDKRFSISIKGSNTLANYDEKSE